MIKDELVALIEAALERAAADGAITRDGPWAITLERPRRSEHGDWSTNVALARGALPGELRRAGRASRGRLPRRLHRGPGEGDRERHRGQPCTRRRRAAHRE